MVNIFASFNDKRSNPSAAVNVKNDIGAQQKKSVKTRRAILFATRESLEFHADEPRTEQYIFM